MRKLVAVWRTIRPNPSIGAEAATECSQWTIAQTTLGVDFKSTGRYHYCEFEGERAVDFGTKLRALRNKKGMTLRELAAAIGVSFTYLSKIENSKVEYTPAPDTIRALAKALDVDPLEMLKLADKLPPELDDLVVGTRARKFLDRAREIASPEDWSALLTVLEEWEAKRRQT
jgi:transcriptional regulator with XRE-family HTH domain